MNDHLYKPCGIKALVVVIDRAQTEKVAEILRSERVRFNCIALAEGTAGSEIMALLGLDSIDKSFVTCLETDYAMPALLAAVSSKLNLRKPGKGIAFTMRVSGLNKSVLDILVKDAPITHTTEGGEELENAKSPSKFDLIVSVVGEGHAGELMESARAAGATGGTVLHGRKLDTRDDAKFLGITAQLEKDIVAILATRERKNDIMRAITKSSGLNTEARGFIFSLPVDEIEGIGPMSGQHAEGAEAKG
ncbi:MAG: hypothetical protein LBT31_06560 [Synergistaceae bacterium]|jgi:hypothetical protein|nr:hypothetical protein [Synergistaceae bacterium]